VPTHGVLVAVLLPKSSPTLLYEHPPVASATFSTGFQLSVVMWTPAYQLLAMRFTLFELERVN